MHECVEMQPNNQQLHTFDTMQECAEYKMKCSGASNGRTLMFGPLVAQTYLGVVLRDACVGDVTNDWWPWPPGPPCMYGGMLLLPDGYPGDPSNVCVL
jgi:hypothetical protein